MALPVRLCACRGGAEPRPGTGGLEPRSRKRGVPRQSAIVLKRYTGVNSTKWNQDQVVRLVICPSFPPPPPYPFTFYRISRYGRPGKSDLSRNMHLLFGGVSNSLRAAHFSNYYLFILLLSPSPTLNTLVAIRALHFLCCEKSRYLMLNIYEICIKWCWRG